MNFLCFKSGDILKVTYNEKIYNGYTTRSIIGRCIALKKKKACSNIIIRVEIKGISLEKTLYIFSPSIISIKVKKKIKNIYTRKKKLYFLRLPQHKKKNKINYDYFY